MIIIEGGGVATKQTQTDLTTDEVHSPSTRPMTTAAEDKIILSFQDNKDLSPAEVTEQQRVIKSLGTLTPSQLKERLEVFKASPELGISSEVYWRTVSKLFAWDDISKNGNKIFKELSQKLNKEEEFPNIPKKLAMIAAFRYAPEGSAKQKALYNASLLIVDHMSYISVIGIGMSLLKSQEDSHITHGVTLLKKVCTHKEASDLIKKEAQFFLDNFTKRSNNS